ncbi:hypothetical protein FJT64_005977 [Amphibalanus amphitrite]|uniref:Uncharacterized protein n=1 Tax=Amphibalanus amphitrite TaxID=1232801 RepID=A0A6A4VSH5_AMPAM|nr:hypothetical protein FJT64_005977 [Amphibalanus amphitrite]
MARSWVKGAVKVDESEMAELMDVEAFRGRLDAVLDRLRDGFIKQFSVRTSIGELNTVQAGGLVGGRG